MVKIKICGMTRVEDILTVNACRPDYVGFVFARQSKRCVTFEDALGLRQRLAAGICPVGVFVNALQEDIAALAAAGVIGMVQLHGAEDDAYIARLRTRTPLPVIKAFRIDSAADVRRAVASAADYVLLDNGAGGTGHSFDWSLIADFPRPYFLAGGLEAGNVATALARCTPEAYAVDGSSRLETDGVKDAAKIHNFINAVRGSRAGSKAYAQH